LNVKNVKIVDKLLSRQDVAKLLGQADVLVLPLVEYKKPYFGMPSKLYEYQAVGKPIICCSRGLPKDYVKETNSGLIVFPGDDEALAKAVIELKKNPSLAQEMGENGRKYVENEASIETVGSKMKEIFETLVQKTSGTMSMSKKNEVEVYDTSTVSENTGEIEEWDEVIFPNTIRRRLTDLLKSKLQSTKTRTVLDYGCGGGWLSILMFKWGFDVVGIDISAKLIRNARIASPKTSFIVCDGENLPFCDKTFDSVVGISILHHTNLNFSLNEIRRITNDEANFIFEEPNLFNPFSAVGRKLFPMKTHTKGEKQFIPTYLEKELKIFGFNCQETNYLFFIAFPIARVFKLANIHSPRFVTRIVAIFEDLMEKMPYVNRLNSSLVVSGKTN